MFLPVKGIDDIKKNQSPLKIKKVKKMVIKNSTQISGIGELKKGDIFGGFIIKKPLFFSVTAADNPTMQRTLNKAKEQGLNNFKSFCIKNSISKELPNFERIQNVFLKKHISKFMTNLRKKSLLQHNSLIESFKKEKVPYRFFLNEQGKSDEVFATDTGKLVTIKGKPHFISANFKNEVRKGEEISSRVLMEGVLNIPVIEMKTENGLPLTFEGGDARKMPGYDLWFMGGGFRTGNGFENSEKALLTTAKTLAKSADTVVIPVNLKDPEFYHLDCCFFPLEKDKNGNPWAVIYEGEPGKPSMDKESLHTIKKLYGDDHLIKITRKEASNFATNGICVQNANKEKCIFVHKYAYSDLNKKKLKGLGYKLVEVPYDAMHMSGGSIRCTCQEIPKSTLSNIMKSSDDSVLERTKSSLSSKNRELKYDKKKDEFILRKSKN